MQRHHRVEGCIFTMDQKLALSKKEMKNKQLTLFMAIHCFAQNSTMKPILLNHDPPLREMRSKQGLPKPTDNLKSFWLVKRANKKNSIGFNKAWCGVIARTDAIYC